ncbi:uncharacterized protein AMSG_00546 [Thecamonas trahens ATCC 50062]|uniref:Uncharacterized protein n=1 Tax=Thecamonas trahens ATCC 50062 TaxID=461836 RepID=A0A0L0D8V4_THETB|nr:hypothetical protein AMSG_00546 [Thecamonas trahens ATCC 50062]KNC48769.1 hypothetical protein AMSG_00546 [Thecamonas trahens ATCC 50062]|eukprot:XP_013762820.1 hypothetical protein AMSG_00546 [Thecamonas trahens ATCC 50062]
MAEAGEGGKKRKKGRRRKKGKSASSVAHLGLAKPVKVVSISVYDDDDVVRAAAVKALEDMQFLTLGKAMPSSPPKAFAAYTLPAQILEAAAADGTRVQTAASLARAHAESDAFDVSSSEARDGVVLALSSLEVKDILEIFSFIAAKQWTIVRKLARHGHHPALFKGIVCSRFADELWLTSVKVLVLHVMDAASTSFAGLLIYSTTDSFLLKVADRIAAMASASTVSEGDDWTAGLPLSLW